MKEVDDINMGLDGKLYAMTYNSFPANIVYQLDPNTMQVLGTIHLTSATSGSYVTAPSCEHHRASVLGSVGSQTGTVVSSVQMIREPRTRLIIRL